MVDLGATAGVNDYDARIYQSILNSLAIYGGDSRPILVSSDKAFANLVEARGYQTIRPNKHSESEILRRLTVPSELVK